MSSTNLVFGLLVMILEKFFCFLRKLLKNEVAAFDSPSMI